MKKMLLLLTFIFIVSCANEDNIRKTLKENPDIITDAIKANPALFIETLNEAVKSAQDDMRKKQQVAEQKKLEEAFDNPMEPQIRKDETFRGNPDGVITLVEYSDFECPYCSRGFNTVQELLDKYEGKIRFVFKHLPLSFHPNAMPAAQYYEAIRLQSEKKAFEFHDQIFENQSKLKNGTKFLDALTKKVGANLSKVKKDINSKKVKQRIEEDLEEAKKFGFQGTPGFLINGVPVKGAYPSSHFVEIVKKLEEKGKLKL